MPVLFLEGPRSWAEKQVELHTPEGAETIRLHPEAVQEGQCAEEVTSMGFFASQKMITALDWVDFPKWFGKEWDSLWPLPAEVILAIRVPSGQAKKLPKVPGTEKTTALKLGDRRPAEMLEDLESQYAIACADNKVRNLLGAVIADQYDAVCELFEKSQLSGESEITMESLQRHANFATEASVFAMMDALAAGRLAQVYTQLSLLQDEAEARLPQVVGGMAYVVRTWIGRRRFPPGPLRKIHRDLVELDQKSKSTSLPKDLLLRQFVDRAYSHIKAGGRS